MRFWRLWDKAGIYMVTIVIFLVFASIKPIIMSPDNLINILTKTSLVAIAAAGMTFAITARGFDLSIGSIVALTTCVFAKTIPLFGLGGAIITAIAMGAVLGWFNGVIITKFKIQTFVATLATMIIYRGLALIYTQGKDVSLFGSTQIKVFTTGEAAGIPLPIIMMLVVYLVAYLIYKYTAFGVYVRSIGSNESASRISGIKADRVIIWIFIITAVTSVIAGGLLTSQLLTGSGKLGKGFELDVITAAILGGTALSGGKGNLWGTLAAAIMLSIVQNGLNLIGVEEFYQQLAKGIILVLALSISGLREVVKAKVSMAH
jgi:ribose transport system permease protein